MAHRTVHLVCLVALLTTSTTGKEQTRWSRQISSYTSDISDWVPLTGPIGSIDRQAFVSEPLPPIKRQAVAEPRILSEPFPGFTRPTGFSQESFPSRTYFNSPANKQLYLQSVPSAPQNFLTDQGFGQSIRFGLAQPNFPLSQGFVAPQFGFENSPAVQPVKQRPQPIPTTPIKFDNFQKQNLPSIQAKPFLNQPTRQKPEPSQLYIDGYRAENTSSDFTFNQKKKVQPVQKIKFEHVNQNPKIETIASKPKSEREEVQLLYVPLESLNRGQFNFRSPITQSQLVNTDLYSQALPKPNPVKQPFINEMQRPLAKPIDTFSTNQDYYSNYDVIKDDQVPKYSTISSPFPTAAPTTPKPKKLKPHQPPLAIFMSQDPRKGNQIKVGDVLSSLKTSNTIAVLDTVNPVNAPRVFIGPSSLKSPENFVKFELPYLSNIENSDKKLRQLPFFVAPLSYNTPNGFAKIPFPSPHVGSVVINSLIKDTASPTQPAYIAPPTPAANIVPNSYTGVPQEHKAITQKPNFSYYSTSPPISDPSTNSRHHLNYYSVEPQTVTSLPQRKEPDTKAIPQKTGSYFLTNVGTQYNPTKYVSFPTQNTQQPFNQYHVVQEHQVQQHHQQAPTTTTTPRTTVSTTTTKSPATYPSQLLETHNPYSINQAFHFSTPLDYHTFYDDYKDPYSTQGVPQEAKTSPTPAPPSKTEEVVTEKQVYQHQSSPNYLQSYSPEIHYESEVPNTRYPSYNTNTYPTKTEVSSEINQVAGTVDYNPAGNENLTASIINKINGADSNPLPQSNYDQYEPSNESDLQYISSTTSTTTSTTTTRRTPIRTRGRPRYTTTARPDSAESTTARVIHSRKPIRERRPLPTRSRYETNRITTEKPTRKPLESAESTTKPSRQRTRGRIQYKPSENDDNYYKRNKGSTKEQDLAYQRDVLHQNYPVTLMERMSTVDIEAMTEPSYKNTQNLEQGVENYDTENAYAHDSASISFLDNSVPKEQQPFYSSETDSQTESTYISRFPSTGNDYIYETRSSAAPIQAITTFEDNNNKQDDNSKEIPEVNTYATEQNLPSYSIKDDYTIKQEESDTLKSIEVTKLDSQEVHNTKAEDNVVHTTPSYNRVRVRPGVIRQYHQASSTESSKSKSDRRKLQAVTYRPAFDRRRTTMRIEEIEADLKTKQIHARPDFQDYKHPVYRPEPTTEPALTTESSVESTSKRGHFRRRRPVYTTSTTEAYSTRKSTYDVKGRFRGRRPTEKPTDRQELATETTTTARSTPYNRYSHRTRLSERYNKKPENEAEETGDQESNSSINRPKYVTPDSDQWSPKFSVDSFKPYNPNDIVEESKSATSQNKNEEDELDIITAKNDYDDILLTVTPATNNRGVKKIPDIPPTLEALVEQSKTTKADSSDNMSTFESMLEEVMKSLEEQDQDEYSSNVMKHKGGEIGEIPPERIISSGDEYGPKTTPTTQQETGTSAPTEDDTKNLEKDHSDGKAHRRGYWKKVKVRPVATETIEAAESQYYANTVNRLGDPLDTSKISHDKSNNQDKPKLSVTTYKPNFQLMKDFFEDEEDIPEDIYQNMDITKIDQIATETKSEEVEVKETTTDQPTSPGDLDLGTGSPDPTIMDSMYYSTPTEPTSSESMLSLLEKSDGFSFMDYLFGTPSINNDKGSSNNNTQEAEKDTTKSDIEITTEQSQSKQSTTESSYIPDEITTVPTDDVTDQTDFGDIKKLDDLFKETTENQIFETSSQSSFMNPANVVSTSMSTEVSHETEICFRGKCIKTNKDIL